MDPEFTPETPVVDVAELEAAATDEATENEGETGETQSENEAKQGDKTNSRNGRRARRIRALSEENARLADELDRERAARAQLEAASSKQKAESSDPRPRRADFDDADEYDEARDAWLIRQATANRQQAEDKGPRKPTAAETRRYQGIRDATEAGQEKYSDYDAVVGGDIAFTEQMIDAVLALDDDEATADVSYYLGNHPKEAERLSQLKGTKLALEVGRIAAGLSTGQLKATAKPKKPSGAPPPINPVGGGDTQTRDLSKIKDIDAWMAARNKQVYG